MATNTQDAPRVIPAQLSFLAIYNPTLGTTDDTFQDQVVFYYSRAARARKKNGGQDLENDRKLHDEENEKLRQIGLAQGMVNFARSFSGGKRLDSIDTEKSRIVMHEPEPNWWIIASIDLTRIPLSVTSNPKSEHGAQSTNESKVEYSAREVSSPSLLITQLIRAYGIFLLHNGPSISSLFAKIQRPKFLGLLERFWTKFALNWDVLLHGNPAVDVLGATKLSAGGELGMGVGEEEWGSGEREVLEDFARRTDGLVDMIVSRFGGPAEEQQTPKKGNLPRTKKDEQPPHPWMAAGTHQQAHDGVIFSGNGTASREGVRVISNWMQWIYSHGDHAYGVRDHPSSDRRKRKRRTAPELSSKSDGPKQQSERTNQTMLERLFPGDDPPPGIPKPIFSAAERSLEAATAKLEKNQSKPKTTEIQPKPKATEDKPSGKPATSDSDTWTRYLTLGYGTVWGPTEAADTEMTGSLKEVDPEPDTLEDRIQAQIDQENSGHFLVGLKGDLEDDSDEISGSDDESSSAGWNRRILVRTLHVPMANKNGSYRSFASTPSQTPKAEDPPIPKDSFAEDVEDADRTPTATPRRTTKTAVSRLRVLVYVHRPFIYTLLFDPNTPSLSMPPFYRHLHTFLFPMQKLLVKRTGADSARERNKASGLRTIGDHVWDIVHDPRSLTVCASIPSIPQPNPLVPSSLSAEVWSRADALNVHSAVLDVARDTRVGAEGSVELERSLKTTRGWWIVWMRANDEIHETKVDDYFARQEEQAKAPGMSAGKEVFLIRRSRDAQPSTMRGKGRSVSGWGFGSKDTSKLDSSSMGIGFDARRYVEGLVGLGR